MEQKRRWSSLPDDIIINIINRIDLIRDTAVAISTTNFSIKHDCTQYHKPTYNIYEYWTILDNLFTLFVPSVIDTFCLKIQANHYDEPRCWPIIETWARQLRSRNVQHLKLSYSGGSSQSDHQLCPPSVFRMHSLVTLELDFSAKGIGWRHPNSIVLPKLKKLCISKCSNACIYEFNYANLGKFLSCCPSLEDLSLSLYDRQEIVLSITSTSLKRLCIFVDGPSLGDVIIDTPILEQLEYCSNSLLPMQMLDSISNVKSLRLQTGWPIGFKNCLTTITLPKLIRLKLSLSSEIYQAIFEQQMMHCPKLEVLVLCLSDYNEIKWNQEVMFMLVQQVKHMELYIEGFNDDRLNIVAWLLRSAKVLEKLVFFASPPPSNDNLVKLFACVETTSRCQVKLL